MIYYRRTGARSYMKPVVGTTMFAVVATANANWLVPLRVVNGVEGAELHPTMAEHNIVVKLLGGFGGAMPPPAVSLIGTDMGQDHFVVPWPPQTTSRDYPVSFVIGLATADEINEAVRETALAVGWGNFAASYNPQV